MYDADTIGPCCQKIDDMIGYARPIIARWPPFHRYTLGEDIMKEMLNMLRLATKARLRYMNKSTLSELDTSKAILEVFVKQANSVIFTDRKGQTRRLITDQNYGTWSEKIDEIGRLIGGWIESVKNRKNADNRRNAP